MTQMSLPTVSDATWLLCSGLPNPLTESGKDSSMSTAMFGLQTFSIELGQQQKFRSYTLQLEYIYNKTHGGRDLTSFLVSLQLKTAI